MRGLTVKFYLWKDRQALLHFPEICFVLGIRDTFLTPRKEILFFKYDLRSIKHSSFDWGHGSISLSCTKHWLKRLWFLVMTFASRIKKPVLLQQKELPRVPWKPWPLHFPFLGAIQEVSEFLSVCLIGVCKLAHQQRIKINHSLPGSPVPPTHQMVIFHHAGVAQTFFLRSKYDLWFLLVKFGSLESKEILRNGVDLITSC